MGEYSILLCCIKVQKKSLYMMYDILQILSPRHLFIREKYDIPLNYNNSYTYEKLWGESLSHLKPVIFI